MEVVNYEQRIAGFYCCLIIYVLSVFVQLNYFPVCILASSLEVLYRQYRHFDGSCTTTTSAPVPGLCTFSVLIKKNETC